MLFANAVHNRRGFAASGTAGALLVTLLGEIENRCQSHICI